MVDVDCRYFVNGLLIFGFSKILIFWWKNLMKMIAVFCLDYWYSFFFCIWQFFIYFIFLHFQDYHRIIKSSMDLGTKKKRLKNRYYWCAKECVADFDTMFSNCYIYYKPGVDVVFMGQTLERVFLTEVFPVFLHENTTGNVFTYSNFWLQIRWPVYLKKKLRSTRLRSVQRVILKNLIKCSCVQISKSELFFFLS